MIPADRIRQALLNVEKRQLDEDIIQIDAAISHLLTGGKDNYDAAKHSSNRHQDYKETSEKILETLNARLQDKRKRLRAVEEELTLWQ